MTRVLLAGESWTTTSIHVKGFDSFTTVEYAEGGGALIAALERAGHDVTFMPNHVAATAFPFTRRAARGVRRRAAVRHRREHAAGAAGDVLAGRDPAEPARALRDWVLGGGGLGMVGGYLSFQGIEAKANYRTSPLAGVLPVEMELGDDREETPEGAEPVVTRLARRDGGAGRRPGRRCSASSGWSPRDDADVLATVKGHPLLVLGTAGHGRTAPYTTDIGPHWAPIAFTDWPGFGALWDRVVRYLAGEEL